VRLVPNNKINVSSAQLYIDAFPREKWQSVKLITGIRINVLSEHPEPGRKASVYEPFDLV